MHMSHVTISRGYGVRVVIALQRAISAALAAASAALQALLRAVARVSIFLSRARLVGREYILSFAVFGVSWFLRHKFSIFNKLNLRAGRRGVEIASDKKKQKHFSFFSCPG